MNNFELCFTVGCNVLHRSRYFDSVNHQLYYEHQLNHPKRMSISSPINEEYLLKTFFCLFPHSIVFLSSARFWLTSCELHNCIKWMHIFYLLLSFTLLSLGRLDDNFSRINRNGEPNNTQYFTAYAVAIK